MNNIVKESVDDFFNNLIGASKTIIEGPSEKTWNEEGYSVSLIKDPLKYFVALFLNRKLGIDFLLHFENYSKKPFTDDEKEMLFNELANSIKKGSIVTTEGGITPGGISAFKKLEKHGFKKVGTHYGKRELNWALTLLNRDKFDKWLSHADPEDYILLDKKFPPSLENTRPVVWVLEKVK